MLFYLCYVIYSYVLKIFIKPTFNTVESFNFEELHKTKLLKIVSIKLDVFRIRFIFYTYPYLKKYIFIINHDKPLQNSLYNIGIHFFFFENLILYFVQSVSVFTFGNIVYNIQLFQYIIILY